MDRKRYRINEVFYSLQGEGLRAGTANVFVRFTGCNLRCAIEENDKSPGGFDCDTEFASGRTVTCQELVEWAAISQGGKKLTDWIILTGGEPSLQVDESLISTLHDAGYKLAIETNGTTKLPEGLDWVSVSPKSAEHTLRVGEADEIKYVRGYGQGIPKPVTKATYFLISPAFGGRELDTEVLKWAIDLVEDNPKWRLSVQQHNFWKVR